MRKFALIGKKLGHSYSQRWFEELFAREGLRDYSYELVEMSSLEGLREWVQHEGVCGFNVTVPYKQAIIPLLDELDETAAAIGAVNCVTVEEGRLVGHNTDASAFQQTLEETFQQSSNQSIKQSFILGTGGAARAVAYALGQLGIPYTFVSRTPEKHDNAISYDQLSNQLLTFNSKLLTINATPVGMYPDVDATPLDLSPRQPNSSFFTLHSSLVYDLIYNPSSTRLLREAAALGAQTKNGLEMLHRQAELSWEFFRCL
jgi:shikimate dehydrogenase